MNKLRW